MEKKFIGLPKDGEETVLYNLALYKAASGRNLKKTDVIKALSKENLELSKDFKTKVSETFPELRL